MGAAVGVQGPGEGGLEPGEVGPALDRVDVVGVGEDALGVGVVVLEGDLNRNPVALLVEEEHLVVKRGLVVIEVLDEALDPALVAELVAAVGPLVDEGDADVAIEEGQFAQALGQDVVVELLLPEDLGVELESDLGPGGLGAAHHFQGLVPLTPGKGHVMDFAVALDLDLEPFREGVDRRDPDPVQAPGDLVGGGVELAPRVELGQCHFHPGDLLGGVLVHRDPAAVVAHRDGTFGVNDDVDPLAVTGHRLVDGIVHHLVDAMVKTAGSGIADIHGGPFPDRLYPLENLYVPGFVIAFAFCRH